MTWVTQTASTVAWAMPTSIVTGNEVDFQLRFRNVYPMVMRDDRPLLMQSSLSEGQP